MAAGLEIIEAVDDRHFSNYFRAIAEFREENRFCDVTICVTGRRIRAHRSVLAACSPFFDKMFDGDFAESTQNLVELLHETTFDVISSIIDYMYSGKMTFFLEDVVRLMKNFDYFGMTHASWICKKAVIGCINNNNCIILFEISDQFEGTELYEAVIHHIGNNFEDISKTISFKNLTKDQLESILLQIHNINADTVYETIINWIKYDIPNRKDYVEQLLEHVHEENLSYRQIHENILKDEFLRTNNGGCKWLVVTFLSKKLNQRINILERNQIFHIFSRGERNYTYECNVDTKSLIQRSVRPKLTECGLTRYGNTIYGVGGERNNRISDVGLKYDTTHKTWQDFSFRVGKRSCGVCTGNDKMFLIGGYRSNRCSEQKTCTSYDYETGQWMVMPDMKNERIVPGVSFYNSSLYVFGGTSSIIERFDPREGQWTNAGTVPLGYSFSSAIVFDSIYCLDCGTKSLFRYDPRMLSSIRLNPLPQFAWWIGSLNEQLYLLHWNGIEIYHPPLDNWNIFLNHSFEDSPVLVA